MEVARKLVGHADFVAIQADIRSARVADRMKDDLSYTLDFLDDRWSVGAKSTFERVQIFRLAARHGECNNILCQKILDRIVQLAIRRMRFLEGCRIGSGHAFIEHGLTKDWLRKWRIRLPWHEGPPFTNEPLLISRS